MMNIFQSIAIIALGILGTSITNGEVGQLCESSSGCHYTEICRDGFCNCENLMYTSDSVPFCENVFTRKLCYRNTKCMENSKCVRIRCQCNEGYHRFTDACRKVKVQGLMMSCGNVVDEETEICDITKHSLCQSKICVCAIGFVANRGKCERKSSYLARNKLAEYRVKPGLYCRKNEECLDGLFCKNFTCSCPNDCTYERKREICDCGEVDPGQAHIYVGVFLGILIMIFWYKITKRTIKKHKHSRTFRAIPGDSFECRSYSLSPIRSETTANASPSSVGLQPNSSPLKQEENSPPPAYNDIFPTQPQLPNPINPLVETPPTTSELGPPLRYSLLPTATDSIASQASSVLPPYDIQPAFNPYYQEVSNTGSADDESKFKKQD